MPTSRAEPTTDHAASETAAYELPLPGHGERRGYPGAAGPRPAAPGP